MNSMLYIIVALVIILVVVVVVLRKKKAQPPHVQPAVKDSHVSTPKPMAANTSTVNTKFDDVTVAQRFIDQQRYDKAIETLQRGLIEKPNDSAISLKLLNVYALSDQKDAFYNTYADITAQGDMVTIAQARQLKELLDDDGTTAPAFGGTADSSSLLDTDNISSHPIFDLENTPTTSFDITEDSNDAGMSLDFDLPTPEKATTPSNSVLEKNAKVDDIAVNPTFDLTLDDLEGSGFDKELSLDTPIVEENNDAVEGAPLTSLALDPVLETEPLVLDFETTDENNNSDLSPEPTTANVDNDDDFALDFDNLLQDNLLQDDSALAIDSDVEDSTTADSQRHNTTENDISDDAFSLDFDITPQAVETAETENAQQELSSEGATTTLDDDFTLFLEDIAEDTDTTDTISEDSFDSANTLAAPLITQDNEQSNSEPNDSDALSTDFIEQAQVSDTSDNSFTLNTVKTPTPAAVDFHDLNDMDDLEFGFEGDTDVNTDLTADKPNLEDDGFIFDGSIEDNSDAVTLDTDANFEQTVAPITAPVITDDGFVSLDPASPENSITASNNFDAQFAEDFDFVNTLDGNQITLDLANQYLQLGEYDSAKRLLNEVVNQGSAEQRQQAQTLLSRTA